MIKKVAFTMYPVKDLDRAVKFYEDNLNLSPSSVMGEGQWIEYDLPGGGCFALTSMATGVEPSAEAGGCITFEVEDLEKLLADLKAKNVTIKLDLFQTPVCRLAVIIDSEGNAVTLHQLARSH